ALHVPDQRTAPPHPFCLCGPHIASSQAVRRSRRDLAAKEDAQHKARRGVSGALWAINTVNPSWKVILMLSVDVRSHRPYLRASAGGQKLFLMLKLLPSPEAARARPNVSLAVVVDTSGSMREPAPG